MTIKCSFCGKTDDDVKYMVVKTRKDPNSPTICNECIADCVECILGRDPVEEETA